MLSLTQTSRWKWACVLAAMYFVCALAPGMAYAFGSGVTGYCALAGIHNTVSDQPTTNAHVHHDHHAGLHESHGISHATAGDAKAADKSGNSGTSHHKGDQACCMLACVSALPATAIAAMLPIFDAVEQPLPFSQALTALTPAQLFKPPIG